MMIDAASVVNDHFLDQEDETKSKVIDLMWRSIEGQLKPENVLTGLNELKVKYGKNFESLVADVVSLIDVEISSFVNPGGNNNAASTSMLINSCPVSATSTDAAATAETPLQKRDKFYSLINSIKSFIGDDLLKERLEVETLEGLKLVTKKEVFNQKYIKIKTRLFYKQQKFNLLREEPEGYSKLITELGQTNLNRQVLENIQSLIGCFNLDPNRVLDIVLESFENQPSMYETYIALLKHYKPDEETICQIMGFKFQSLAAANSSQMSDSSSHSHSSVNNNNNESLYKITSYLLKHQLVDLDSLLAHLSPSDAELAQASKDEFEAARQYAKKLSSIQLSAASGSTGDLLLNERGYSSGGLDSSSSGGGGGSSSGSGQGNSAGNQPEISQLVIQYQQYMSNRPRENQRISLVKSLIEIEDYATAMRLIDKMPQWYVAGNFEITVAICRALDKNFIDSMYRRFNLLSGSLREKYLRTSLSGANKKSTLRNQRSILATMTSIESTTNNNNNEAMEIDSHEHNHGENSEHDLNQMLDRFVANILPVLCALGPGLSYDPPLFTKIIRICQAFLSEKKFASQQQQTKESGEGSGGDNHSKEQTPPPTRSTTSEQPSPSSAPQLAPSQVVKQMNKSELAFFNQVYTLLNEILLPSLSMLNMNPCLAIEIWNLLKLFPYEMRYNLYHNWRLSTYKNFPSLIRTKAECQEKIKYLLKRLTKENVKIHGRQIGKLSHNNPIIVCDYILAQIQRYDNFILPVVESLKFMTPLSYDILSYCIIVAISDAEKDKMKHDSTNLSTWLQSIATFCALAFKKYPIELIAMIQFVINQLKQRKSYDLLILQEIVQKMSGIEVLSEVNDLQLEAMAGGDLLRQEAGYFNPIRNIKKCANRLKEALADHGLILPLCILLSQQRDYIVFLDQNERERQQSATDKTHLKLTGCFYDQCQDSLVQFSQFLSSTLTTEEYIHIFPKIDELVQTYHVSPDVAFFLSRPMYAHHIQSKYDELRRADRNTKSAEKPSKTQRYLEAIEYVMQPVIDLSRSLHPAKVWEDMSPLFYVTFWTLSMADCFVPSTAYEKQRQSLRQKIAALDDQTDLTSAKKKKEKEKLVLMIDKLSEEEGKQRDHVGHVKARFEKEKDHWFPQKSKTKNDTITVFLQFCIFSRCLFTQIDAYYCAKFIHIIHSLKTPNFSTIICYDRIFSDISYSIASLTDNESRRYGRFLLGLLETVMSWHADPVVFDAECSNHPGFLTVFRNALNTPQQQQQAAASGSSTTAAATSASTTSTSSSTTSSSAASAAAAAAATNKQEQLDYENFRHVCHKWHYKLTKAFIICLESDEYLQMRNSLIILTKILPHFPKLINFSGALEKRVEKLKMSERDKRQDIFTLASAYLGQLKLRKPYLIEENKFHLTTTATTSTTTAAGATTTTAASSTTTTTNSQKTSSSSSTNNNSNNNGGDSGKSSSSKLSSSSSSSQFKQPNAPSSKQSSSTNGGSSQAQASSSSSSSRDRESSSSGGGNNTTTNNSNNTTNNKQATTTTTNTSSSSTAPTSTSATSTTTNGSTSDPFMSSSPTSQTTTNSTSTTTSSTTNNSTTNGSKDSSNTLKSRKLILTKSSSSSNPVKASESTTTSSSSSSSSSSSRRVVQPPNSASSTPTTPTGNSPPSNLVKLTSSTTTTSSKDDSTTKSNGSSSSSSTRVLKRSSVPSSPKTTNPSTPTASSPTQLNGGGSTTDPNDRTNEYSPTSSVSSDELPESTSPSRRSNESNNNNNSSGGHHKSGGGHHHHHHHHHHRSRSSSPQSSSTLAPASKSSRSSGNGEKSKRAKMSDDSNTNQNGSSKIPSSSTSSSLSEQQANSQPSSQTTITLSSSQNSSSSSSSTVVPISSSSSQPATTTGKSHKRRDSRDRHSSVSADHRESKESKKEHRKREHSIESGSADFGVSQQKRSKSDEKKNSSSTSSSSKRSSKKNDLSEELNTSANGGSDRRDERRSAHSDLKSSSSYKR